MTAGFDPLWVPLLTHYKGDTGALDLTRMAAQVRHIRPHVQQFLLGGSTGDGWDFTSDQIEAVFQFGRSAGALEAGDKFLVGILRASTEAVIQMARRLEDRFLRGPAEHAAFVGFAICPPVDPGADQNIILGHYRAVLNATRSPIAVYELPQVTGCSIAPSTLEAIAENPRVRLFKDTSGRDVLVRSVDLPRVAMVRGAEGGYFEALKPQGGYDGWLLSTANVFGAEFRRLLRWRKEGEVEAARRHSARLSAAIEAIFAEAAKLDFGNPFSNANRAADHVLAYGSAWRDAAPPTTGSGQTLPLGLLTSAAAVLEAFSMTSSRGYLNGGAT